MTESGTMDTLEGMFGLVANDIRLDILWTLWDYYTDDPSPKPDPVPFSTLKRRVGVRDSGRFHYHLDELVPQFVTHHEEGYTLTYAGARIVGAGFSGVYTDTDATLGPRKIDECANCDGMLEIRYNRGHAVVDCDSCDAKRIMSVPPILIASQDVESHTELLGMFTLSQIQQTIRGFCHLCSGPVEGAVADSSLDGETNASGDVKVTYECTECGAPFYAAATTVVLDHPIVVSLLYESGIDYREVPPWRIARVLDAEEHLRDDDPLRVEVTVAVANDSRTLVLDENLEVIESSRN